VRYRAGLIDISSHNVVTVTGTRAAACLDHLLTSDITRLQPGQTHCSNIVNEQGGLIDDVLVYCDAMHRFRLSHGEGVLFEALSEIAGDFGVAVARDDDVHVLSLQGPRATPVLARLTPADLHTLTMGVHRQTTVLQRPVTIARGGFFGEVGYEIFCARGDAVSLWDGILAAGAGDGVVPISWRCLEIARVEAGLLFLPYADTTPWEVGAGWTVDLNKQDFRGKAALASRKGRERSRIVGLEITAADAAPVGAPIFSGNHRVGVVTSSVFSRHLMKSIAMAHVSAECAPIGTAVTIDNGQNFAARVVPLPFYDPLRLRTA
jgi:aminomethyltransferase